MVHLLLLASSIVSKRFNHFGIKNLIDIYIYMYSVESAVHLFVLVKVSSLIEAHAANLGPKRLSVVFRGFTKQDAV